MLHGLIIVCSRYVEWPPSTWNGTPWIPRSPAPHWSKVSIRNQWLLIKHSISDTANMLTYNFSLLYYRDEDFPGSPGPDSERRPPPPLGPDDRRIPPFNPDDRRMPFHDDRRIPPMEGPDRRQTPMGPRVPPPHPMDIRSPPPFDRRPPPPLDRRSPPPYERGLRLPPPPLDRRSPGQRMPFPPDMPPPHLRGLPRGPLSPPLRNDGHGNA